MTTLELFLAVLLVLQSLAWIWTGYRDFDFD